MFAVIFFPNATALGPGLGERRTFDTHAEASAFLAELHAAHYYRARDKDRPYMVAL